MNVPVPSQYAAQVTTSWNAYQDAVTLGSPSLVATALAVLMLWLNKCNTLLSRPVVKRPYPDPPIAPAVVEEDGVIMLEYN